MVDLKKARYWLVCRGGATEGKRPNTKLVYNSGSVSKVKGSRGMYLGFIFNETKRDWSKSARPIHPSSIVRGFNRFPTKKQIQDARKSLKITPKFEEPYESKGLRRLCQMANGDEPDPL